MDLSLGRATASPTRPTADRQAAPTNRRFDWSALAPKETPAQIVRQKMPVPDLSPPALPGRLRIGAIDVLERLPAGSVAARLLQLHHPLDRFAYHPSVQLCLRRFVTV
ncbi:hypothetical protein D3C87_1822640 [compost metagenome]